MKISFFYSSILICVATTIANAQDTDGHAGDIEFGYDSLSAPTTINIEAGEITTEGVLLFESEFEVLDPNFPNDLSADEPGFINNPGEGFSVTAGHSIRLQALNASQESSTDVGVGYVNFYNPDSDALEASHRIAIKDNSSSTADLLLNGDQIESGPTSQFIGVANSSDFVHDHVVIDLLDDATADVGAFGLMFNLQGFDAAGTLVAESDPFWIVVNNGMDEEDFENFAVPRFSASAVPEPTSATLVLVGLAAVCVKRRRR